MKDLIFFARKCNEQISSTSSKKEALTNNKIKDVIKVIKS